MNGLVLRSYSTLKINRVTTGRAAQCSNTIPAISNAKFMCLYAIFFFYIFDFYCFFCWMVPLFTRESWLS